MYDLIVIGGGMSGISVAHQFRDKKILLLERDALLAGATGNNAGFVIAGFGEHFARTVERIGAERARKIQELHRSCHQRLSYQRTGSFAVATNPKEARELSLSCTLLQKEGYPVQWIDKSEVGLRNHYGALFNPDDGILESAFWSRLAEGLPIKTNCIVESVTNKGEEIQVETVNGSFTTAAVVFCLNAFADNLVPEIKGKHILLRGQMLELPLYEKPPTQSPIFTQHGDVYWRFTEKTLLFGGLEHLVPEKEMGIAHEVSPEVLRVQLDWIQQNFDPALVGTRLQPGKTWCSTMSYSVDGFPFVGALPQKDRYILGSLCGMGNSYALEAAYWLHELIANDRDIIPSYCSSDRMNTLPAYTGGDWRKLYEAWNHGIH